MRHGKKFNHLGRQTAHRKAMFANMANSLIEHKRINTTIAKAFALAPPAIVGLLRYAHFADRIHPRHATSDKHINLPQLRDNLLGLVSLVRHSWSSVC